MDLLTYAQQELDRIGMIENHPDEMNREMHDCIFQILRTFQAQGHSGFSGNYLINIVSKLLKFNPLTPLTGEDNEWILMGNIYQNKRYPYVFKTLGGKVYDSSGRVFVDKAGSSFQCRESQVEIEFPYTPKTEVIHEGTPEWADIFDEVKTNDAK